MSADVSQTQDKSQSDNQSHSKEPATGNSASKKKGNNLPLILIAAAVVILLFLILTPHKQASDPNIVSFSGRIESPETFVTAGVAARINSVLVKEGDHVSKGQLLVLLDKSALNVKLQATHSEEQLARQAQSQAGTQVASVQQDVATAQKKSHGFFAKIFTSKKKKEEVKEKLTDQMKSAKTQEMQAKAAVIKAQAAKGEIASKTSYFNITSPIDGVVVTRSVDPGEAVGPGQILLSVANPADIYMKGFVAEGSLSQIKIGQHAKIFLDAPDGQAKHDDAHTMDGQVSQIDDTASFTPQNVYFKDDRVKQVFGIKLTIDGADGRAKAGMPVDAQIDLKKNQK